MQSQKQEIHTAVRKIECLEKMKLEMEIEIEALTGLHQIKGNLESKVKILETELSSTRLKVSSRLFSIKIHSNSKSHIIILRSVLV